jgi:uncharacterized membrane protein YphA (DoxX/SURF4 family)
VKDKIVTGFATVLAAIVLVVVFILTVLVIMFGGQYVYETFGVGGLTLLSVCVGAFIIAAAKD